MQHVWGGVGGTQESAFPTSAHEMLMLLVGRPHLKPPQTFKLLRGKREKRQQSNSYYEMLQKPPTYLSTSCE